jgi:hypothetical protein
MIRVNAIMYLKPQRRRIIKGNQKKILKGRGASSILGRCRNNDCGIGYAHDLCDNACCYMATSTMVVKEEIILTDPSN